MQDKGEKVQGRACVPHAGEPAVERLPDWLKDWVWLWTQLLGRQVESDLQRVR